LTLMCKFWLSQAKRLEDTKAESRKLSDAGYG
jgi:hypothetical protein